jgi:uncharacterized protein YcfJ
MHIMKTRTAAAIAIASLFTAAAPAFAQGLAQDRPYNSDGTPNPDYRDSNRYENRDYRDYRDNRYDSRDDRNRDDRYRGDVARVLESRPVYGSNDRREECWNPRAGHFEEVRGPEKTRVGKGAAIGAVAGGVVGNQIGDHSTGGTVAGALIGGLLGHQVERRNNDDEQNDLDRSRCRVIAEGSGDLQGYDVRYVYRGNEYVARMDRDPGRTLRVGEDINRDGRPFQAQ